MQRTNFEKRESLTDTEVFSHLLLISKSMPLYKVTECQQYFGPLARGSYDSLVMEGFHRGCGRAIPSSGQKNGEP